MKFLKRFNEELSPEVYRKFANIRSEQGDPKGTVSDLRRHADKMEGDSYEKSREILKDIKEGKRTSQLTKEERELLIDYGIWWLKYEYTNLNYNDSKEYIHAVGNCPRCGKYGILSTELGGVKIIPQCHFCFVKNKP